MTRWPRRGEIYLVDFDPTVGSEQGGYRPALIIQNDASNEFSPVTIVAAISSRPTPKAHVTDVWIDPEDSGLRSRSRIVLNQIRTLDKVRLGTLVGTIPDSKFDEIDEAIQISLGVKRKML